MGKYWEEEATVRNFMMLSHKGNALVAPERFKGVSLIGSCG